MEYWNSEFHKLSLKRKFREVAAGFRNIPRISRYFRNSLFRGRFGPLFGVTLEKFLIYGITFGESCVYCLRNVQWNVSLRRVGCLASRMIDSNSVRIDRSLCVKDGILTNWSSLVRTWLLQQKFLLASDKNSPMEIFI